MNPGILDELAKRLAAAVPEGVATVRRDLENNFRAVLQSGLASLNLVTRTEFDVQAGVLQKTREKLAELEQKIQELEKQKP